MDIAFAMRMTSVHGLWVTLSLAEVINRVIDPHTDIASGSAHLLDYLDLCQPFI
jgi:hypothetical protein